MGSAPAKSYNGPAQGPFFTTPNDTPWGLLPVVAARLRRSGALAYNEQRLLAGQSDPQLPGLLLLLGNRAGPALHQVGADFICVYTRNLCLDLGRHLSVFAAMPRLRAFALPLWNSALQATIHAVLSVVRGNAVSDKVLGETDLTGYYRSGARLR